MKKNYFKILILTVAMLFGFKSVEAQVTMIDTMSNLQTCFKPDTMRLGFTGLTGGAGAGQYVDVQLPAGHTFEGFVAGGVSGGGTITYGGLVSGFHRFNIVATLGNSNMSIRFLQMAKCGAGTGSYTANDSVIFYNGATSFSKSGSLFNGVSPDLSITTGPSLHTPSTATVGTVVTRKFTVTNGGFGASSNFILVDKAAGGGQYTIDQSSFWIDTTLATRYNIPTSNVSMSGDSIIIKFDATTIQNIADLDTAFENGESFELTYKFTVNTCLVPTISTDLLAYWMCPNTSRCNLYKITTGIATFGPAFPRLVLAQRLTRKQDCFDGTTIWKDTLVLRNNSTGAATDIIIDAGGYRSSFSISYRGAYFDTSSFKVKIGKNGVEYKPAFTVESKFTSSYTGCNFTDSVNHIRFTIPYLAGGDSLYIMMGQVQCAYTKSCIVNQSFSSPIYTNGQYAQAVYKNACGNATYNMAPQYVIPYRSHYVDGTNSGPLSIGDGQSADLSIDVGNFSNNSFVELMFGNRAYREVTITKPNVIIYDPAYTNPVYFEHPTHGVLLPYYRSANGDTFKFRISNLHTGLGTVFHAKVKGLCDGATCSGILEYSLNFAHNPDTTSCSRLNPEICLKYPFAWTSSCIVCCPKGMVNLKYELNRTNYGLGDDNNNGLPSGTLDLSKINTKRVIAGDTVEFVHKFYLKTDGIDTQWDDLRSLMTVGLASRYTVLSDSVWVDRLVGTDSIFSITPSVLGTTQFNTDLSFMPAFQQGDTVTIKLKLRVIYNPVATVSSFNSKVGGGASNDNFVTSYACGSFIDKQEIWGTDAFGYQSFAGVANGCQQYTIAHRFYVRIGGGTDRYQNFKFPYEYRPIATPLKLMVKMPANYTVDSVEFGGFDYYAGQVNGVTTYAVGTNVPFTHVDDTLRFDVRHLFAKFGGNIITGDEGCYLRFNTRVTPSCKTTNGLPEGFALYDSFAIEVPLTNSAYNIATSANGQVGSTLANFHPNLIYSSPLPVANAYSKEVSWPLSVNNLTVFTGTRNWLYFTSNSGDVTIDSLMEGSTKITKDANGFYIIGDVAAGGTRNFTVFGTSTACNFDSVTVNTGWSCGSYPTTFTDSTCSKQPIPLYVQPQPASIQTQITSLSGSPIDPFNVASAAYGSNEVTMCNNFPFEMEIQSTQPGTIYDVKEQCLLPFNAGAVGLDLDFDSITIEYPIGTTPRLASHQGRLLMASTIGTGAMTLDLQKLDTANFGMNQGLPGTGLGTATTRRVKIRWKMKTNCDIISGAQWNAQQLANAACGTTATGDAQITSGFAIDIAGVIKPYVVSSSVTPRIGGCSEGNCDTSDILITKIGPNTTTNDSVFIIVPSDVSIGAINCYGANCPGGVSGLIPSGSISNIVVAGDRIVTFAVPSEFDNNGDTLRLAIKGWRGNSSSGCQDNLLMQAGVRIPATLTCLGVACPASNANLGVGTKSFDITLPDVSIAGMGGWMHNYAPADWTYTYTAWITNSSNGATVESGDTIALNIYLDDNKNSAFDPGVDILLATHYYSQGLLVGQTTSYTDTFTYAALPDNTKPIFAVIETDSMPNCNCTKTVISPMIVGLPVDWLYFNVKYIGSDNAMLDWATASEEANTKYGVERSLNGFDFETISQVNGKGLNGTNTYEYMDDVSGISVSSVYYRIKELASDGTSTYTPIKEIALLSDISKGRKLNLYPNPTRNTVNVRLSLWGLNDKAMITVVDLAGKTVMRTSMTSDMVKLDLSSLNQGMYLIQVKVGEEVYTERVTLTK